MNVNHVNNDMTQSKKSAGVRVKLFSKDGIRCAFPHFFTPWANENEDDTSKAKYQGLICLDKEYDTKLIEKVEAGVREVVEQFWGKAFIKKIGKSIDNPLTDGEDKDKYEVLENYLTLSAKKSAVSKGGKELPPPKMMAVKDGKYITPDHKDWNDELMMTGRYSFVIDLYTSENANKQGNKVCVGLVSILAQPPLEGDEEEPMPGFGAVETPVEDDFGDFLGELGVEAAIPSDASEFEDEEPDEDDSEEDESDEIEDNLDEELDEEPDEDDSDEEEPEEKPAPRKRGRKPAAVKSTATRKKRSDTGEDDSTTPRKTARKRTARTRTAR